MSAISQPPVQVSPLIRGARWVALLSGIAYGYVNYNRLSKKEARHREIEAQREEAARPLRLAAKKQAERETYLLLNKEAGIEIPAEFK